MAWGIVLLIYMSKTQSFSIPLVLKEGNTSFSIEEKQLRRDKC